MVDVQFRFRDDETVNDPAVTVDSFSEQSNATAVRIEPGDDARDLLPYLNRLSLVEVSFPAWTDGRGYSSARILREAGYRGEMRAVGDLVIDMLHHLRRCGFDAFAPEKALNEEDARNAFDRWENVYQATVVDGCPAIWAKRHPA
ncbi:MAG: oxidoreductase [Novosphingobium lindaniclasticum]|jgi:uncharacterized protein (DUF934 family)|uniref:DUF934 domain-containing protein n=1 Tax=Novosphingobium lindaniclasticum TaxID=1329895 RepID=UPI00240A7623|nr:DUF934 domain-containing protein [Novosphingobium lindaniclasticum]MDF2638609.1 oxidoreductase [Novosphingobium lindaniclasticum]